MYSYEIDIAGFDNPFISIWNTETDNPGDLTIGLPLIVTGTYDFIVDWGDGIFNRIQAYDDPNNTHIYATAGIYTVRIFGTCVGWNFYDSDFGYSDQIIDITQWGILQLEDGSSTSGYFGYTTYLLNISAADAPDLSNSATTFNKMFYSSGITNIISAALWDTSQVTDMNACFQQAGNFIGAGIGAWDVSNVTDMSSCFQLAASFVGDGIEAWDMSSVGNTQNMFQGASSFNPSSGILDWDVSSLVSAANMFAQASVFNCSLPWTTTTSCTDMSYMFQQAVAFEGLGLENWVTTNVTTLLRTFDGIDSDHLMAFTGNVSDWDVSNVENMTQTFNYCASFNRPLNWTTTSCTSFFQTFTSCILFNQDMPNFVTSTCTVIINILNGCTAFNGDISTWDLSGITGIGMIGAFYNCSALNNAGLSSLNAPNATSYENVFGLCTSLDQDFSSWPITNITNANDMFVGVTLSNANYNALLIAWNAATPNDTVVFGGGNSHYDGAGVAAHDSLTGFYSWFITDGGTP